MMTQRCPFKTSMTGKSLACEGARCAAWDADEGSCLFVLAALKALDVASFSTPVKFRKKKG